MSAQVLQDFGYKITETDTKLGMVRAQKNADANNKVMGKTLGVMAFLFFHTKVTI